MGWLFAVALGLQEKTKLAVLRAVPPIALGHTISVAGVVLVAVLASSALPARDFRLAAAFILIVFGLYRFIRARHLRWVGMRVGFLDLTLWAFLMATGHGAGLMLIPVLVASSGRIHGGDMGEMPMHEHLAAIDPSLWYLAVGIHTLGYLVVMTAVAYVVYVKFGLELLRKSWLNLDLIWSGALIASGALLFVV